MTPQPLVQGKRTDGVDVVRQTAGSRPPDQGRRAPLLGKIINGRYRVLDALGAGSLGTVYLCEEIPTNRKAALKVFRRDVSRDDEFVRRLRRQVTLASTLGANSPSVVTAYECGQTDDGSAFIATEYLQGRTLRDVIRRGGSLDIQRVLRMACQIAEGLDAIHGAGFVHGDVRPENVILVPAKDEEVLKLKGFEVAGVRDTALVDQLMRAGVISSNAEYLAPEQVEGNRATVRTDIYAFGVVLFEMLTGRVPFSGTSPDSVMAKQLQDAPAPLNIYRRGIPSVVELRVKQALEKEPERRQRYVGDVVNEYLCELSSDEMLVEVAQQKRGVVAKVATTVQARLPRLRRAPAERTPLATGWKIGALAVALVLAAVVAVWLLSSFQEPLRAYLPSLPQRPGVPTGAQIERPARPQDTIPGVVVPPVPAKEATRPRDDAPPRPPVAADHEDAGSRESAPPRVGRIAPSPPSSPQESSLRPPGARERVPTTPRAVERTEAPLRSARKAQAEPAAPPPSSGRQEAPVPTRSAPDATAIIDWLLGQPSGRE
jgi:serine/threonine-protein kinase